MSFTLKDTINEIKRFNRLSNVKGVILLKIDRTVHTCGVGGGLSFLSAQVCLPEQDERSQLDFCFPGD